MNRRSGIVALAIALASVAYLWWSTGSPHRERAASASNPSASLYNEAKDGSVPLEEARAISERTTAVQGAQASARGEVTAVAPGVSEAFSIRLFGSVVESEGRPFSKPDTVLELTDASGRTRQTRIEAAKYAFDGLKAGRYLLRTRKPGFKHFEREVVLDGTHPEEVLDITIERAWTIDVHLVTPDGEELRTRLRNEKIDIHGQPTILCTIDPPGDRLPPSLTENHSREGLGLPAHDPSSGMDSDRIYVQGEPPIHVSVLLREIVLASQRITTPVSELTFEIPVEKIRGLLAGFTLRLVNGDTGLPATDASLSLDTDSSGRMGIRPDEQGQVRIQDRLPGRYEIRAFLRGYAMDHRVVDLLPGVVADLGTITFSKGLLVSGRCVDEDGAPKRVPMTLTPISDALATNGDASSTSFLVRTGEDGHFSLKNLASNRYLLRVRAAPVGPADGEESGWSALPILVDTTHGSVADLVVVVSRPLHVTLRPTSPEVSGMAYQILTNDGLVSAGGSLAGSAPIVVDLVKGNYTLRLSRDTSTVRDLSLRVTGDTLIVEIDP